MTVAPLNSYPRRSTSHAAAPAWHVVICRRLLPVAVVLLPFLTGCSTLASLGLPVGFGPHQLLGSSARIRNAATHAAELPNETAKDVLPIYLVEPGDVLVVEPAGFDSPVRLANGDQTVKPDGSIDLGKYGHLRVAGKTVEQIQSEVQALVESGTKEDPGYIDVRLVSWDSKVIYVLGEVNSPGAYPYSGRETILDALLAAGDLTSRANRHKIIFTRPSAPEDCRLVLPVCYQHIVQLGDTSTNYQLLPGDRIFVPSLTFSDDLVQTLIPGAGETCPRCSGGHVPCLTGLCPPQSRPAPARQR